MNLRDQYIEGARITRDVYERNPVIRVRGMYRTARQGSINDWLGRRLWTVLEPLHEVVRTDAVPRDQRDYDDLVVDYALAIQESLLPLKRGGFGIGQKLVNLYMKDQWALRRLPEGVEPLLHAPLDRPVLSKLASVPRTWAAWSKVEAQGPAAQEVVDYLAIQRRFREYCQQPDTPFASTIELEQFIWTRI